MIRHDCIVRYVGMIENPVDLINHINYASQVDMLKS